MDIDMIVIDMNRLNSLKPMSALVLIQMYVLKCLVKNVFS
jgi:hypothetical protein